jgi:hypothetical protein
MLKSIFADADVISVYTRGQAIEDGVLVDVSETAREAGFRIPVALTAAVWATVEAIPPKLEGIQDVQGRLWDVLWMANLAARRGRSKSEVWFKLLMDRNEGGRRLKYLTLKMVVGPGDGGEPVITIMLPHED